MLVHCATEDHKVQKIPEEPHPINLGEVWTKLNFIHWKKSNVRKTNYKLLNVSTLCHWIPKSSKNSRSTTPNQLGRSVTQVEFHTLKKL